MLSRDTPTEEAELVEAASSYVKARQKLQGGKGTKEDELNLLSGEMRLRRSFPSLSLRDTDKLAKVIVDLSSWSLRQLIGMPIPIEYKPVNTGPTGPIERANWHSHVFDAEGKSHSMQDVVTKILGKEVLTADEILERLEEAGYRFYTRGEGARSGPFRDALRRFLDRMPTQGRSVKFRVKPSKRR